MTIAGLLYSGGACSYHEQSPGSHIQHLKCYKTHRAMTVHDVHTTAAPSDAAGCNTRLGELRCHSRTTLRK